MKYPLKLAMVVLLAVIAFAAPLFAGYCLNCYSGWCESGCSPYPTNQFWTVCLSCTLPDGTFACTACLFQIYLCLNAQGYQCSYPPYIFVLVEEVNTRRTYQPYSCVYRYGKYHCE